MSLTVKQSRLLNYLRDYMLGNDVAPSFEQMRAALDVASKSEIHRLLGALAERGYITRQANRARCITLIESPVKLEDRSAIELRSLIAQAAGLAAFKDGDGGALTALALRNIADRLSYAPRKVAA